MASTPTPNEALRYPAGTPGVPPDVAGDIKNLALDADGKIHEVRGIAEAGGAASTVTSLTSWSVSSGWQTNRIAFYKVGRHVQVDMSVTRTGSTIAVGASGNIPNVALGHITNTAFLPVVTYASLASGPGGSVTSGYVRDNGSSQPTIFLAAYGGGGIDITAGTEITLSGVYLSAS